MKLLSIIIPFYNSENKSERVITKLCSYNKEDFDDVEIICINDGSTDGTANVLKLFESKSTIPVSVIHQENKGPGGARNAGFKKAQGEYVWFVDSDDSVYLHEVMQELRFYNKEQPDFIDFNVKLNNEVYNSINIPAGVYTSPESLYFNFGHLCSKVFKREFLIENQITYPEYCIYEDNPLGFIFPFYTKKFVVSDKYGYIINRDFESVTRTTGKVNPRYWDRLYTTIYGYKNYLNLNLNDNLTDSIMKEKLAKLYVINTIKFKVFPSSRWLMAARVMNMFREHCAELKVKIDLKYLLRLISNKKPYYKIIFCLIYLLSFTLPSQANYFKSKRLEAWGKPFLI